ncbi:hypothetical protein LXL04_033033 [Taraxacum kok-saghyz]
MLFGYPLSFVLTPHFPSQLQVLLLIEERRRRDRTHCRGSRFYIFMLLHCLTINDLIYRAVQMRTIIGGGNGGTNLGHLFQFAADQFSDAGALLSAQHIIKEGIAKRKSEWHIPHERNNKLHLLFDFPGRLFDLLSFLVCLNIAGQSDHIFLNTTMCASSASGYVFASLLSLCFITTHGLWWIIVEVEANT